MSKIKQFLILFVVLSVAVAVTVVAAPIVATSAATGNAWATSERGIEPDLMPGNDTPNPHAGFEPVKVESPSNGTHTITIGSGQSITVVVGTDGSSVPCITHWESEGVAVGYVVVKAGPNYFDYDYYMTGYDWDNYLYPPLNPAGNNPAISHYTFYYKIPEESSTDPEETTVTETTTEETSEATTTETTPEETTVTETTTEETTEATTTETTPEETTVTETTTEETTEATTTETTPEETTVTETTTEETSETLTTLTTESIPLTSPTTTEPVITTVTEVTTTETFITLTTESIPKTGETGRDGSGNGVIIGIILLIAAGALTFVVYRRKPVENES